MLSACHGLSCQRPHRSSRATRASRGGERSLLRVLPLLLLAACGRTGLDAEGAEPSDDGDPVRTAVIDASNDSPAFAGVDVAPRPLVDGPLATCQPTVETCNGADDDCNGKVDDGLAPIPCPGGGSRYCVAGHFSSCPERCEVCVPGSQRVCYVSYCLYWGVATCAADGKGFGPCREERPPSTCAEVAKKHRNSPELERCCIDDGYCCLDEHDLDGDGNRGESLGQCDEVVCRR
ncbi:MAG TPA: hypothetical protein VJT73_11930 [Polyangiaceae bacterium]|nr:hypothetical protein [Polyangiaceae bacterium]